MQGNYNKDLITAKILSKFKILIIVSTLMEVRHQRNFQSNKSKQYFVIIYEKLYF